MGKRAADASAALAFQRKKPRLSKTYRPVTENNSATTSILRPDEVDFPRGGGSSLSAVDYKLVRAEALKELNDELVFKDGSTSKQMRKGKISKSNNGTAKMGKRPAIEKASTTRVEHLNYKRVVVGMKLLVQVIAVRPFALIVSLPNLLLGHVPMTQISTQLTALLESSEQDDVSETESATGSSSGQKVPELEELFRPGQFLRAIVSAINPANTTTNTTGFTRPRDAMEKASRRVELSLKPEQVNAGTMKSDLSPGHTLTAAVRSREDHGYTVEIGVPDVTGFLPFGRDGCTANKEIGDLPVGTLIDVVVSRLGADGRTCVVSRNAERFKTATTNELANVSSLSPGVLVEALVTAVLPSGLNVQLLGSFVGTVDIYHLPRALDSYKPGKKLKARVLYDLPGTSPPQFSLSANEHIIELDVKRRRTGAKQSVEEAFSVGTILPAVIVKRVESEHGLVVEIEDDLEGHVHISQVSDDHVPSLSPNSGKWKIGTVHQARITGFHPLDGLLQLSLRPSVLAQRFLRVDEVHAGDLIKGAVKKLTDKGLFVAISGSVDGVVWPNHYADIPLKRPQKRFRDGASVNCRVLVVDADRKRIVLTAKKSLVESDLPTIRSIDDATASLVTHAVVWRVFDRSVGVEFYNNVKATVPFREVCDTALPNIMESFPIGKTVKVRILTVDRSDGRIVASIRQVTAPDRSLGDPSDVEVGQSVSGLVEDIHSDNAVLSLQPSNVRALISLNNIANHRDISVSALRGSLKTKDQLEDLVIVSRNIDKNFVIVATQSKRKKGSAAVTAGLNLSSVAVGDNVSGHVNRITGQGAIIEFSGRVRGVLHPTDVSDDFDKAAVPTVGATIDAVVLDIEKEKRRLILSTRKSRLGPSASVIVDREVSSYQELLVGEHIRGFVKSITDHGLFVCLGRKVDARVQIREMFDEFVNVWKECFHLNQVVSGRILSVDVEKGQAELALRTGSTPKRSAQRYVADLKVGSVVNGKVKRVEAYGVFINVNNTRISGLCHKSEITDSQDADVALALLHFREGDDVKAMVIAVDPDKNRISFGLKPSYFAADDLPEDESVGGDAASSEVAEGEAETTAMEGQETDDDDMDSAASDGDGMVVDLVEKLPSSKPQPSNEQGPSGGVPALKLQGGFQWSKLNTNDYAGFSSDDDDDDDDDDEPQAGNRQRKRKKEIEIDLTADLHTKTPESTADFERYLLASPNSSYLWIQYMSFQLQLAEVAKAREIGKRALQTISIREEKERLNVWIAFLNLENLYGTDDSLEASFKDAARHNDSKTIHLRLAAILDESQKHEKAEEQYKRTIKKFKQSSKVWCLFGEHYYRGAELDEARRLLTRSLLSLQRRKHLKTISKFAQLEYKLGEPERGKTLFEGIVDSHPRRWDLWSIYVDMEAGQRDIQSVRNLFDRVLALKMTSYKAKAFFKKWLELERRIGDEQGIETVKEKAIEWTRRVAST